MALCGILERIDAFLTSVEERIIYFLLALMLAVVFVAVLNRFLFQLPMSWSEELARYLMIWAAFIGASLGVKRAVHISIDAVTAILPASVQRTIAVIAEVVAFVLCAWLFYIGLELTGRLLNSGQVSPAMRIPMYFAYAAVPSGFFLMASRYLIIIIARIEGCMREKSPLHTNDGDEIERSIS